MGTIEEVTERRKELYKRMLREDDLKKIAQEIANKYDVDFETIRNEWYDREEWLSRVFHFDNAENTFDDLVAENKEAKRELWWAIRKVKKNDGNYNHLIGAVRTINNINNKLVSALQSHGSLKKEPDEINVKHEINSDIFKEAFEKYIDEENEQ